MADDATDQDAPASDSAQTLSQMVRAKYPGVYDDLSDQDLESRVKAKYPGVYDDVPLTSKTANGAQKPPPAPSAWDLAWDATKQFASNFNPVTMAEGLYGAAKEHPAVAALAGPLGAQAYAGAQDQYQKAKTAYQQKRYSEMAGHTLAMMLPLVGPAAANVGEELGTGDPETMARGGGDALALAVAPKVISTAVGAAADALPAIKATMAARQAAQAPARVGRFAVDLPVAVPPSNAAPYSTADVTRAAPYLAAEHADTPVSTVPHVVDASDSAISQIEDHVADYIAANPNRTITTDPLAAVRGRLSQGARSSDVSVGLKELDDLGLENPNGVTLADADAARQRLNAENKAQLKKNNYDTATALKSDPAFAARYEASSALRDGIYDALADQGVPGVRELRQDEGSLIAIRNAAQRQIYNGSRQVAGTGSNGPIAQAARRLVPAGAAAVGAEMAGPAGAAAADIVGRTVTNALLPGNLTRDALVAKAFQRLGLQSPPSYPSMPSPVAPVGLLTAPATPQGAVPLSPSGPAAVPPVVGGTSQPNVFGNRLQIGAGTANGELTRTNLGPKPDTSGGRLLDARPILVKDPATGRFKRVYTTEPKGGS